jgi:hypothetical protein
MFNSYWSYFILHGDIVLRYEVLGILLVALETIWEDRRKIEPNEVLPELSRWTHDHKHSREHHFGQLFCNASKISFG